MRTVFSGGAGVSSSGSSGSGAGVPAAPAAGDAHGAATRAGAETGTGRITRLDITCSHRRTARDGETLWCVADNSPNESISYGFELPGTGDADGREVSISGSVKSGTSDTVATVTIETEGAGSGRKQVCIKDSSALPGESQWSNAPRLPHTIPVPTAGAWPRPTSGARTVYVFGRGDGDAYKMATVKLLPSKTREVTLNVGSLAAWVGALENRIKAILPNRVGPATVTVSVTPPTGSFSFAWGWKEQEGNKDAQYHIESTVGLRPIVGVTVRLRVSLTNVAGVTALGAIGVVPPLSTSIMDAITDYGISLNAFIEGGVSIALQLTGARDDYASGRTRTGSLNIRAPVNGTLRFGLSATIGDPDDPDVELRGDITTGIELAPSIDVREQGLFLQLRVIWPGATAAVTFSIWGIERPWGQWQAFRERQLYPTQGAPASAGEWQLTGRAS